MSGLIPSFARWPLTAVASLAQTNKFANTSLGGLGPLLSSVRWSSKSKGNRACRQGKAQKGHEYGWKLLSGQKASAGQMLVKQKHPRFHPGLNVIVKGDKMSLHAALPGKVLVTREKVHLNTDNQEVAEYYVKRDMDTVYKKYYHVIPEPQMNEFQLVAQI